MLVSAVGSAALGLACTQSLGAVAVAGAAVAVIGAAAFHSHRRAITDRRTEFPSSGGGGVFVSSAWWAHPALLMLFAGLPPVLLAWRVSAGTFETAWRTPKYFTGSDAALGVALLIATAAAASVGAWRHNGERDRRPRLRLDGDGVAALERVTRWLLVATLGGYAAWAALAVSRGISPGAVLHVVSGTGDTVSTVKRAYLRPVAGVTTFAEFGPVVVSCLVVLRRLGRPRTLKWISVLLVLGFVRAILDAERLALVELVVPAAMVLVAVQTPASEALPRRILRLSVPLWIPVLLIAMFGGFEYIRSWSSFYRDNSGGASYSSFALTRLEGYYATAENNSKILLTHDPRSTRVPYYTGQWLWTFPVVGKLLNYDRLAGADPASTWLPTLQETANPEFNNSGGILVPVFDFGRLGALIAWTLVGFVVGRIYAALRGGSAAAIVAYAVLTTGMLEIGRILYWPLGRAFPGIVGLLLVTRALRGARSPASVASVGGALTRLTGRGDPGRLA